MLLNNKKKFLAIKIEKNKKKFFNLVKLHKMLTIFLIFLRNLKKKIIY